MPFPQDATDVTKLQTTPLRQKLAEFREYEPTSRTTYNNLDALLEDIVREIENLRGY